MLDLYLLVYVFDQCWKKFGQNILLDLSLGTLQHILLDLSLWVRLIGSGTVMIKIDKVIATDTCKRNDRQRNKQFDGRYRI